VGCFGFSGGEADAVDDGVGVADGADGLFELEMAASIEGLADEKDGAAVLGWLVAEEVDRKAEGVEDGGAVVAEAEVVNSERGGAVFEMVLAGAARGEVGDGVCGGVEVGGEAGERWS
jgi:hypothetical protein